MSAERPVVAPRAGDPRWPLLAFLLSFALFALASPGFSRRPEQWLAALAACLALDFSIAYAKGIALVPLSGLITSMGVLLLCDAPSVWAYALVAALSTLSKQFIRVDGRHVFNPNNFGIVAATLFFSGDVAVVAGRWGGRLPLMGLCALLGAFAAHRAGRLRLSAAYVGSFFLGALARKALSGAPLATAAAPMTGAAFWLFTFYMITDPKTSPRSRPGQWLFGAALAALDNGLRHRQVNNAPFYSLFAMTALLAPARDVVLPALAKIPWRKTMLRRSCAVLLLCASVLPASAPRARAEEPAGEPAASPPKQRPKNVAEEQFFDPATEVRRYDHLLDLSDDQKVRVRGILDKKLALFKKNAALRRDFGEKSRKLHDEILRLSRELEAATADLAASEKKARAEMRGVLRADQLERFDGIDAQADRQEKQGQERARENEEQEERGKGSGAPPGL